VPRQDSGDGKERLGRISKKGNAHFRNLKADMERAVSTINFQYVTAATDSVTAGFRHTGRLTAVCGLCARFWRHSCAGPPGMGTRRRGSDFDYCLGIAPPTIVTISSTVRLAVSITICSRFHGR
jgi:hypothetical protein